MQNRKTLDTQIRSSLSEAAAQVAASDLLEIKIRNRLESRQFKEENKPMRKIFTLKRVIVVAAAVCCLSTATVFASGVLTRFYSSSSNTPTYTSIPSSQQLKNDVGFSPKIIKVFSNGYDFKNATIANGKAEDDSGKVGANYKELSADYTAADRQDVMVDMNDTPLLSGEQDKGETTVYNGTNLKYSKQVFKCVPANYKLTSEDKKAQADGSVAFSYGSDKVSVDTVQFVECTLNGINYQFMTKNANLSEQDLIKMAQELVDMK